MNIRHVLMAIVLLFTLIAPVKSKTPNCKEISQALVKTVENIKTEYPRSEYSFSLISIENYIRSLLPNKIDVKCMDIIVSDLGFDMSLKSSNGFNLMFDAEPSTIIFGIKSDIPVFRFGFTIRNNGSIGEIFVLK